MASDPPPALIRDFQDFVATGISEAETIKRLRAHNNNIEAACNEYWNDYESGTNRYEPVQWDETQFNSDRNGTGDGHGISFDIQGPDDPGPYNRFDAPGAPSRPPSRTSNNKSPLSKIIDLTAEHAAADPRTSLTSHEREDQELEAALAASRADAGLPPQESGITNTSEVHFGPATRSQYEEKNWGIVALGKTPSQEKVVDPEPKFRKRDLDIPAFLKSNSMNFRTAALLTIYHEIPISRSILLNPSDALQNYGYDSEWWFGKAISSPNMDDEPEYLDVEHELQRIMAFLDKTDRSYGSVDSLAALPDVKKERRMHSKLEAAVLGAWKKNVEKTNPGMVKQLFSKGVGSEAEENSPQEFAILELGLPTKDSPHETLYDIADETLWPSHLNLENSPYLSHIAEVIAFKVEGNEKDHKNIDISAVWYPDRYLKPARQAALEMRLQKSAVSDELERLANIESRLTLAPLKNGKYVEVQKLFEACLKHDEAEVKEEKEKTDEETDEEDDMIVEPQPISAAAKLSAELRKVMASIDKKLSALNVEKEKAVEQLRNLSKLYTEQSSDPNEPKLTKYTLRGVSTTKNTMYICRRREHVLIDLETDSDEPEPPEDQWWRIHYIPLSPKPVVIEKTTEEKVLEAAKTESKNTVLVYASEKAMNYPRVALPKALETFVIWDNKVFKNELAAEDSEMVNGDSQIADDTQPVHVSSPGKRKFASTLEEDDPERVRVTEREVPISDDNDFESAQRASRGIMRMTNGSTSSSDQTHEVIVGVDPSLLEDIQEEKSQEMTERAGALPMLGGRPKSAMVGGGSGGTIDSMDLDQVVEDENQTRESAAVKRVGFK